MIVTRPSVATDAIGSEIVMAVEIVKETGRGEIVAEIEFGVIEMAMQMKG